MDDLNSLGAGVTLYLRLVKYLAIAFLVSSLIAVPTFYLCAIGGRIARSDVLNLMSLSIGNSGKVCTPRVSSELVG